MTEQSLRRTDELLTELVELVETARTLPMSSSCVVPRERVLDLLDELREVMPPEIDEARKLIGNRDVLLHDAHVEATTVREKAAAEGAALRERATADVDTLRGEADQHARELVHNAEVRAYEIVESGRHEHGRLVSATGVHQAAAKAAAELRAEADGYLKQARAEADHYRERVRADADRYDSDIRSAADRNAAKLTVDSEDYADRTLAELAGTLQHAAATAEQGRIALARRRAQHTPPPIEAEPEPASADAEAPEHGPEDDVETDAPGAAAAEENPAEPGPDESLADADEAGSDVPPGAHPRGPAGPTGPA